MQVPSKELQSERGVSREFLLTLQASDNLAKYRCDATNEAKKVLSAETKLWVQCESIILNVFLNIQG